MGEEAFDGVRADLDGWVACRADGARRRRDKSTGDGVMAAFASTAAALRCAMAIQGAVGDAQPRGGDRRGRRRSPLRIGISVGDAVVDDGDLQGTAVVEAARLCAVADGGTILCSEAVRSVSANRSGCAFGPASPGGPEGAAGAGDGA